MSQSLQLKKKSKTVHNYWKPTVRFRGKQWGKQKKMDKKARDQGSYVDQDGKEKRKQY